eukprot:11216036-Lingulodinium_polyedra.AAC.1
MASAHFHFPARATPILPLSNAELRHGHETFCRAFNALPSGGPNPKCARKRACVYCGTPGHGAGQREERKASDRVRLGV